MENKIDGREGNIRGKEYYAALRRLTTKLSVHKTVSTQNFYVDWDFNIPFPGCEVFRESVQWFRLSQRQGEFGTVWKFILSRIIGTIILHGCFLNELEFTNYLSVSCSLFIWKAFQKYEKWSMCSMLPLYLVLRLSTQSSFCELKRLPKVFVFHDWFSLMKGVQIITSLILLEIISRHSNSNMPISFKFCL